MYRILQFIAMLFLVLCCIVGCKDPFKHSSKNLQNSDTNSASNIDLKITSVNNVAEAPVYFTASANGVSPSSYSWNFGDGETSNSGSSAITSHTYAAAGTYTVTLNVTYDGPQSTMSSTTVTINQTGLALLAGSTESGALLNGGTAGAGNSDGLGPTAGFNNPQAVAIDSNGNAYIADTGNNTIRKVTSTGVVTTLAGTAGKVGSANGTGSAALFDAPAGIAVDSNDNVYVTDSGNDVIREITSSGVVTNLAGTAGKSGSTNGTGAAALFNNPTGITINAAGILYVVDSGNNIIREITPGGVVTTPSIVGLDSYWFTGAATNPDDTGGPLYFTDSPGGYDGAPFIYEESLSGSTTWYLESPGFGIITSYTGMAVDAAGDIYLADYYNNAIRLITRENQNTVQTAVGYDASDNLYLGALPANTYGVAVNSDSGQLIIVSGSGVFMTSSICGGGDALKCNPAVEK